MLYEEKREEIRSGDVLAWTHTKWDSWYNIKVQLVRIFTQSEYCHVGIAWVIGGRVFVFEAVSSGVRAYPLSRSVPFYWMPTSRAWTKDAEEFALNELGAKYSTWQAIKAFLGILDKGADDVWQCAEYSQAILKRLGINLKGDATPSAMIKELQALNYPIYLVNQEVAD
jgi:hypothetical protein